MTAHAVATPARDGRHVAEWPLDRAPEDAGSAAMSISAHIVDIGSLLDMRLECHVEGHREGRRSSDLSRVLRQGKVEAHQREDGQWTARFHWRFGDVLEQLVAEAGPALLESGVLWNDPSPAGGAGPAPTRRR